MSMRLREERPDLLGKSLGNVELIVLQLVSQGRSHAEIAERLGRSVQTVKNHMHVVLCKMGALNSAHAVAIAKDVGLI